MPQNIYRIRTAFLIPLAIDVALLLLLIILSFLIRGSVMEKSVLTLLFIPALFVLIEALRRTITIAGDGLRLKKFFKTRFLDWTDITHVGCLSVRSRVYILLTTTKGFHVISNAYDRFPQMVRELIEHIPTETVEVEAEAKAQAEHPVRNVSDLVAAWVAAAVLTGIIYIKFFSP